MNTNWNCHFHRLWLTIALCNLCSVAATQTKQVDDSQFINFSKSPLVLEPFGDTSQVRNVSSKTVVRFTLACIVSKGKRSTAILKFPAHQPTLSPGGTAPEIRVDAPSSLSVCMNRKTKLAVIDVVFSDGSQWLAPIGQAPTKSGGHFQSDDLDF